MNGRTSVVGHFLQAGDARGHPELRHVNNEVDKDQCSQQGHAAAHPGTAPAAQRYLVAPVAAAAVLSLDGVTLDDVQEDASKQSKFKDTDHQGITHEMSSPVEHRTIVGRVEETMVVEDAGIETNVDDQ